MQSQILNRRVLRFAALALLAGCGALRQAQGDMPPIGAPGATLQSGALAAHAKHRGSWMLPEAKSSDLLYVSTAGSGSGVGVYKYPGGRRVGDLDSSYARGLCSDASGNVFIVEGEEIVEYAHGGSQPIATLDDSYNGPNGCAVDPTTGNLAVAGGVFEYGAANIAIFPNATGSPTVYTTYDDLVFSWCTFDNEGNLFVTGRTFHKGDSGLVELPAGGSTLSQITVPNGNVHGGGPIQWDGKYLAVAKIHGGGKRGHPATIDQLEISGQTGNVVNAIELEGSSVSYPRSWGSQEFWVHNHTIVSPKSKQDRVGLWEYPVGGDPIRSNVRTDYIPFGLTVSVAPSRMSQ